MNRIYLSALVSAALLVAGCGKGNNGNGGAARPAPGPGAPTTDPGSAHAHDEVPIGTVTINGNEVAAAQGHGLVEAGKLMHLVVKLPYNDGGESVVRAWIGTEDRDKYRVGKGEYAASHDDYDIHASAPDPLPEGAAWWIEIEQPDGTVGTGSVPYLE
jgi:hypothetical protein